MKKYLSYIVVAVVLGLLAVLAALQYQWQSQAAEADREKMERDLKMNASQFAEDFNREIQGAYFNFQLDADEWRTDGAFNERFDKWGSKAEYADIVSDIYFIQADSDKLLRYDRQARSFLTSGWTPDLNELKTRLSDPKSSQMIYEDKFALAVPIHDAPKHLEKIMIRRIPRPEPGRPPMVAMPDKFGDLVVMLDAAVIKDKMLPDLAKKYFPDGSYKLSVDDKNSQPMFATAGAVTAADATESLLELSPDKMFFFTKREPRSTDVREVHAGVVMNHRVERRTMSRVETSSTNSNSVAIEMVRTDDSRPRTSIVAATRSSGENGWTLNVQHASGSIDTYISQVFRRNVAIGFGLFSLVGLAVLGISFSAQRAKAFAQRQVDFVSSVSHEFRTPLAVIYSAGENLADGVAKEDGQVSRYGNLIKAEGRKLSGMVEQILEFAGANSGKQKYNFTEISIAEIIRDAVEECRPVVDAGGFVIDTEIPKPLPVVRADGPAIARAVQNLILNSVKFSNGSREIKVTAENGGDVVKISVEDKGIGISKSDLRQIFEPFYRAKEVVDAQIHGNGLGLSLVKQIVEAHGGRVSAESEVGKGSKFTIEIPGLGRS